LAHVRGGRLRALGVTTAKRSKVLPDLPTLDEAGVRGYENSTWFGVIVPAGTPAAIVGRLNVELNKASQAPEIVERIAPDGGEPVGTTPEQFGAHIAREIARWRKVVKDAGIKVE
jgi:tripartite-type tricarboxylate transporter receptor subunit TctC